MREPIVYWTGVEYEYTESHEDFGSLSGGFVYAFAKGSDARDIAARVEKEMSNQGLRVSAIEFISAYDLGTEWDDDDQASRYSSLYEEANASEEIAFDDLYAYEEEE